MASSEDEINYKNLKLENVKLSLEISNLRDQNKKNIDEISRLKECEDKVKEIDDVKLDLLSVEHERDTLKSKKEALENEVNQLQMNLDVNKTIIQAKDSMIEKQTQKYKELESKIKELEEDRKSYQDIAIDMDDRIKAQDEEIEQLKNKVETMTNDLQKSESECSQAKNDLKKIMASSDDEPSASSEGAKSIVLKELDMSRTRVNELENQVKSLTSQLKEAKETITEGDLVYQALLAKMNEQEKKFLSVNTKKMEDEFQAIKNEKEHLQSELTGMASTVEELQSRICEEQLKLGTKSAELVNANKALVQVQVENSRLTNKQASLEEELTKYKSMINEESDNLKDAEIKEKDKQITELKTLLNYREDLILKVHEEISKANSNLESVTAERNIAQAQVNVYKKEISQLRKESYSSSGSSRSKSSSSSNARISELQEELDRVKSKRELEYRQRKRTESDLDAAKNEISDLKNKLKKSDEAIKKAELAGKAAAEGADKAKIKELEASLKTLRTDSEAKRCENYDLKARLDLKQSQVEELTSKLKVIDRKHSELNNDYQKNKIDLEQAAGRLKETEDNYHLCRAEVVQNRKDLVSLVTTNQYLSNNLLKIKQELESRHAMVVNLNQKLAIMRDREDSHYSSKESPDNKKFGDQDVIQQAKEISLKRKLDEYYEFMEGSNYKSEPNQSSEESDIKRIHLDSKTEETISDE